MRVHLLFATVVLAAACGGSDSSTTITPPTSTNKTVDVFTNNVVFTEDMVHIIAGDTVRWNFSIATDSLGHNVRFTPRITGAPADIATQSNPQKSGTASRVFTTSGDFHYVCDLHGSMIGEVIVK